MCVGNADELVAYGVQRGRTRALASVLDDLDELLEDPMATEHDLRTWKRELELALQDLEDHVDELQAHASRADALTQGEPDR